MSSLPQPQFEVRTPQENVFFDKLVVLRGLGVFSIFLFHFIGDVFHRDELDWNGLWLDLTSGPNPLFNLCYPFTYGWTAVFLFFVISGFAVHNSFLRGVEFNTGHFYWRRWWRLYPPYLLVVICFCVLNHVDVTSLDGGWQLVSHLLLIHNFHPSSFHGIAPTLWYVAAEFQLYLLFPILLMIRKRFGIERTLYFTLGLGIVSRLVAMGMADLQSDKTNLALWLFPTSIWFDWTLGAYVAECFHKNARAFRISTLQLTGLIVVFVAMTFFLPTKVFSTPLVSFLFAVILDKYLHASNRLNWIERAILPVGLCSYSLYLWHEPLSYRVLSKLQSWGFSERNSIEITLGLGIVFACVFAWSFFAYATVERWSKNTGSRLWTAWQSRRATPPPHADLSVPHR